MLRRKLKPIVWYKGPSWAIRKLRRLSSSEDGPIPKEIRIKVRKEYKLLNKTYSCEVPGFPWPKYMEGHKVVQWIQTYFADDAEGDEFKPVIKINHKKYNKKWKKQSTFDKILQKIGIKRK